MVIPDKRLKEVLKPKAYADFMKWMEGQTVTMSGVYDHDFLRWILKQPIID